MADRALPRRARERHEVMNTGVQPDGSPPSVSVTDITVPTKDRLCQHIVRSLRHANVTAARGS